MKASGKIKPHRLRCPGCGCTFMNGNSTGAAPCPAECGYNGSCVRISNDGYPKNKHLVPLTSWALDVWRNNDAVRQITFGRGRVTIRLREDGVFKRPPGGPRNIDIEYE